VTNDLDNVQRLYRFCDLMQEDGFCLEAAQVRAWVDSLSDLALTHIDTMPLEDVRMLGIHVSCCMIGHVSQLDVRRSIDKVLRDFQDNRLNLHAIA